MPQLTNHETVYHVGNLERDRGKPYFSFEGRGLCVSHHPKDWRRIARLGGDRYELHNSDAVFYDVRPDAMPEEEYRRWCLENGYVRETTGYEVPSRNGGTYIFLDRDDAESEAFEHDSTVTETTTVTLDEKGREYWEESFEKDPDSSSTLPIAVKGLLVVWYAQNALPVDVDGVWWRYNYDPDDLSCPCGVIFQDKLEEWEYRTTEEEPYQPYATIA